MNYTSAFVEWCRRLNNGGPIRCACDWCTTRRPQIWHSWARDRARAMGGT